MHEQPRTTRVLDMVGQLSAPSLPPLRLSSYTLEPGKLKSCISQVTLQLGYEKTFDSTNKKPSNNFRRWKGGRGHLPNTLGCFSAGEWGFLQQPSQGPSPALWEVSDCGSLVSGGSFLTLGLHLWQSALEFNPSCDSLLTPCLWMGQSSSSLGR